MQKRSRSKPVSTGKEITPTPRDLFVMRMLHEHGPLPTEYLFELSRHLGRDYTQFQKRIRDLYHERNTPHRNAYLARPWQLNPPTDFAHKVVSENTDRADRLLADFAMYLEEGRASPGGSYPHRLMTACITASLEIAVRKNPNLRWISKGEIMVNARALELRAPISFAFGDGVRTYNKPLVPDTIFGIQYPTGRLYYVVEADLNNEPLRRPDFEATSCLRKILQYKEAIGSGSYREALNIEQPLLVLTYTTNQGHADNLVKLIGDEVGPCRFLLTTTLRQFDGPFRVSPIVGDILERGYKRAGYADFCIGRAS